LWLSVFLMMLLRKRVFGLGLFAGGLVILDLHYAYFGGVDILGLLESVETRGGVLDGAILCILRHELRYIIVGQDLVICHGC
jgi:hypothetical protein